MCKKNGSLGSPPHTHTIWDNLPMNVGKRRGTKHGILSHTNPRGSSPDSATSGHVLGRFIISLGLVLFVCKVGLKAELPPEDSCKD